MERNKKVNAILDECLENLITGKETVEQCLLRYPEHAAELEPLLRTAMLMNKAIDVQPSADFRARARYQIHALMNESKTPKRVPLFVPKWAVAICSVLLVFVLGGSTVLAADGSMPGSPLYPVKLTTENMRVKFTGSGERKAELYASIADRRVVEMTKMVEKGKTQYLETSAQRLRNYYTMMTELPLALDTEDASTAADQTVPAPSRPEMAPPMTKSAQPFTVITVTNNINTEATIITPRTFPPPPTGGLRPGDSNRSQNDNHETDKVRVKRVIGYYAVTHPEKLQGFLDSDKVPETAKPALRRALRASESSYKQVIENLDDD